VNPVQASCPACGAPIIFKIGSSMVVICEFCNSVVARGDRRLEDLGKVADLVETGSPLDVGLRGVYRGVSFELTGRAQLGHQAGGIWDEWYAAFQDGRWGWLAEAQGRFYLTFQKPMPEQSLIEPFDMLELGEPVTALSSSVPLVVAEKAVARALGAKGEIPYKLVPGQEYEYADLSGAHGEFATLDYSESPPLVFVGREVALAELGFPANVSAPEREARHVAAIQLSCPQCGGPLELRAPDKTERVTCPNCGSLLDVSQGRLKFLKALDLGKVKPIILLGSVGEFGGVRLTVIGFMQRSVEYDGVRYYWEEYLLYNPQAGFRWLVRSDDNWSFVEPLPPGAVTVGGSKDRVARYDGKRFKLFQDANARVEHVFGEFYWKVSTGEFARAADYIRPPQMLSKEESLISTQGEGKGRKASTGEINWSLGTYVRRGDVEKAFGINGLPRTSKIAPNQPYPHKKIYKYWLLLSIAMLVFGLFAMSIGSRRKVLEETYQLEPLKSLEDSQVRFSEPFELKGRQNIVVTARANVDNSWMEVEGDLINQATDESQGFSLLVEYYHGVEDGESWSEGSQSPSAHISALPAGTYVLGLDVRWEKFQQPATLTVRVEQGVPNALHLFVALLAISIFPIIMLLYHYSFEKRRWEDSDFSPFSSS
jgi:ssDNA-binding Zn-finger/Zn-ribbon topoisomerase 1